jgi:Cu/Zn superoxide dismutase
LRRITKAALGGLAGCALVLGGTGVASGLDGLRIHEDANVLHPDKMFDDAKADITISKTTEGTTFSIRVTEIDVSGIDFEEEVLPLGSHLHTDKCVKGMDGSAAGPHYNHDKATGATTVRISSETEVWFDLIPDAEGMAYDQTTVPFVPIDSNSEMSVVVHVDPTDTATGAAGARQACFPLDVHEIFPTE